MLTYTDSYGNIDFVRWFGLYEKGKVNAFLNDWCHRGLVGIEMDRRYELQELGGDEFTMVLYSDGGKILLDFMVTFGLGDSGAINGFAGKFLDRERFVGFLRDRGASERQLDIILNDGGKYVN